MGGPHPDLLKESNMTSYDLDRHHLLL
jgi:hypothetical protein